MGFKQKDIDAVLQMIESVALPAREICDRLNLERTGGSKMIRHMRENGMIYIARWYRRAGKGGSAIAQYMAGQLPDAVKPDPFTSQEKREMVRQALEQDGAIHEPIVIRRDTLVAAFFGEAKTEKRAA